MHTTMITTIEREERFNQSYEATIYDRRHDVVAILSSAFLGRDCALDYFKGIFEKEFNKVGYCCEVSIVNQDGSLLPLIEWAF